MSALAYTILSQAAVVSSRILHTLGFMLKETSAAATLGSVTVVTVTYGDRWKFLVQQLEVLEDIGTIRRVIVVDNGAHESIYRLTEQAGLRKTQVVSSLRNMGSAAGFKLGLKIARQYDPEWIWLLDDDNLPERTTLNALLEPA